MSFDHEDVLAAADKVRREVASHYEGVDLVKLLEELKKKRDSSILAGPRKCDGSCVRTPTAPSPFEVYTTTRICGCREGTICMNVACPHRVKVFS